jgi:hypothetical protein
MGRGRGKGRIRKRKKRKEGTFRKKGIKLNSRIN